MGLSAGAAMGLSAGAAMGLSAAAAMGLTAGADIVMAAAGDIDRFSAMNIRDAASNDIRLTASNSIASTAAVDYSVTTLAGDVSLVSGKDAALTAAGRMVIGALASDIDIDAATGIDMRAGANMAVSAVSNMTLDASSLYINTGAGNLTLDANESAKQIFRIGGVDVIEVFKTSYYNANAESNATQYTVKINADFEIAGGVNSVGINQTTLNIEDKSIHLSHNPAAEFPYDGLLTNHRSGIIVDGVPESWVTAGQEAGTGIPSSRFEKSFTWNTPSGDGVRRLGDGTLENEAFWELRGGHLKLTHVDEATGEQVSFGFRIGDTKELELYKHDSTTNRTHRVARFGRVL
jgi:hypothetical protein